MEDHQTALKVSFITSVIPHWTDFKTSLEKSRKMWNIPPEQMCSLLPHFHFCWEDLNSIVTWVLWDFGSWRRQPQHASRKHRNGVVRAVPRFSLANLRVLITKRGANKKASLQSLVFTFVHQPHRKLTPRRRIPSRIRPEKLKKIPQSNTNSLVAKYITRSWPSYVNSKIYILHWPIVTPPATPWLTLRRWTEKKVLKVEYHCCSSLTGKHQPTTQVTSWTSKITCVFMWTLSYHVLSTIFNSTDGRKAVSSSDIYLLTPKMENITRRGD